MRRRRRAAALVLWAPLALSDSMLDCASVACPALFHEEPVTTGNSKYVPFRADTRFRAHGPHSMLELTKLLYGEEAELGHVFQGFENPFGKQPDMSYAWTQISDRVLEAAFQMIGGEAKLVVEVGSFTGKSSAVIGNWLRRREGAPVSVPARNGRPARTRPRGATPLLCIDTWLGDLGMTLGRYYRALIDKRHGQPMLYHTWLVNMIEANLTTRVLPLVVPSLLGAKACYSVGVHARMHACMQPAHKPAHLLGA